MNKFSKCIELQAKHYMLILKMKLTHIYIKISKILM